MFPVDTMVDISFVDRVPFEQAYIFFCMLTLSQSYQLLRERSERVRKKY